VLLAACAALAAAEEPLRSVLHQRRLRQALARAEALDPDNPRLRLVAYLYTSAHDADSQQALEAVLAAFRLHEDRHAYPEWGEAEALTLLGAIRLESGDLKGARDLLEEALLIAPDYAAAVQLRRRIHNLTATQ
jgi:tetratricopeptide (TPR) repeat protein